MMCAIMEGMGSVKSVSSHYSYSSPLGEIQLTSRDDTLVRIDLGKRISSQDPQAPKSTDLAPVLRKACSWLNHYFAGEPLDVKGFKFTPDGTVFQQKVWEIVRHIPYGETLTYGEIARQLSSASSTGQMSARAVGQAVGKNPLMLIIPCHRVLGKNNRITGYAGGLEAKLWLLRHERILQ